MGSGHYNPNIEDCYRFCLEYRDPPDSDWPPIEGEGIGPSFIRSFLNKPDSWLVEVDWSERIHSGYREYPRGMHYVIRRKDGVCLGLADNESSTMVIVWSDGTLPGIGHSNAWKFQALLLRDILASNMVKVSVPSGPWTSEYLN